MNTIAISARDNEFEIHESGLYNTNDIAAAYCFGARRHVSYRTALEELQGYDCLFTTMWKVILPHEERWLQLPYEFKRRWPDKLLILHQEAEAKWWLDRTAPEWPRQYEMMELLREVDIFLAHNEKDRQVYERFMRPDALARCWPTIQNIPAIQEVQKQHRTILPKPNVAVSSYDGRANGLLGVAVARNLGVPIMQLTRSEYKDDRNQQVDRHFGLHINRVPQLPWFEWLRELCGVYVYLHPMPAASAGRDTIACATLGIPVVGNRDLDVQMDLFPELAIHPYEPNDMERKCRKVLDDRTFYGETITMAMRKVGWYSLPQGLERAERLLESL